MDYTLLIIDDDEPIHMVIRNILADEFDLLHARDAQEGIDILSKKSVNLILTDIHMPGMSGLEFLESLMKDAEKKETPVLIMTNLPTVEKEKKSLDLGAVDFIEKTLFTEDKEEILNRVRMKLVANLSTPGIKSELNTAKKKLASTLMSEAISGDFISTAKRLCTELKNIFLIDHASFWTVSDEEPSLISSAGIQLPSEYGSGELKKEPTFRHLMEQKEPYLTNHIFNEELGIALEFSRENDLPAEIGIPMFSLNELKLLKNNMEIPEGTAPFACLFLKRNKLFSTQEYEVISGLLTRTGSVLWRLYNDI